MDKGMWILSVKNEVSILDKAQKDNDKGNRIRRRMSIFI